MVVWRISSINSTSHLFSYFFWVKSASFVHPNLTSIEIPTVGAGNHPLFTNRSNTTDFPNPQHNHPKETHQFPSHHPVARLRDSHPPKMLFRKTGLPSPAVSREKNHEEINLPPIGLNLGFAGKMPGQKYKIFSQMVVFHGEFHPMRSQSVQNKKINNPNYRSYGSSVKTTPYLAFTIGLYNSPCFFRGSH